MLARFHHELNRVAVDNDVETGWSRKGRGNPQRPSYHCHTVFFDNISQSSPPLHEVHVRIEGN